MSSPTQGMWTCKHNVDGRDFCDECAGAPARPDAPAQPDSHQLRAFWSQWNREMAALRRDAMRIKQRMEDALKDIDQFGLLPGDDITALTRDYQNHLTTLDALREFGNVVGIINYTGKIERKLVP